MKNVCYVSIVPCREESVFFIRSAYCRKSLRCAVAGEEFFVRYIYIHRCCILLQCALSVKDRISFSITYVAVVCGIVRFQENRAFYIRQCTLQRYTTMCATEEKNASHLSITCMTKLCVDKHHREINVVFDWQRTSLFITAICAIDYEMSVFAIAYRVQ